MPVSRQGASWLAEINHRGQRYRRKFPTTREAEIWEADTKARLLRGEAVELGASAHKVAGKPHTLAELAQYVFDTHWKTLPSGEKALINARSIIGIIGPSMAVAKVGRAEIDKARTGLLATGNTKATVNRKIAALSKMLRVAESLDVINKRPELPRYKEAQHRIRRFTPDEEATVLRAFALRGNEDMRDYVVLSLDTGLRQGEVLALRAHNVVDARVQVFGTQAKSGRTRTVPLTRRAQETIQARLGGRTGDAPLFPSLTCDSVRHHWNRLSEEMGLEDDRFFVPHIMRHEFCSRLADRGRSAVEIMNLAGHSSLTVSQRYIHLNAANLDSAIASLEGAASPAPMAAPAAPALPAGVTPEMLAKALALVAAMQAAPAA